MRAEERERKRRERESLLGSGQPDPTTSQLTKPLHPKEPALAARGTSDSGSIFNMFSAFKKEVFSPEDFSCYLFIFDRVGSSLLLSHVESLLLLFGCGKQGLLSSCSARASRLQWFLLLQSTWLCNVAWAL